MNILNSDDSTLYAHMATIGSVVLTPQYLVRN